MPESESFLIEHIEDDEPISRFLTDEDQFNKTTNRVHHSAFKLPRGCNNLSAYRTKVCDNLEIWDIAKKFVTELRPDHKEVLARADVQARIYKEFKLMCNPNGNPHPRHVNIEGWPAATEDILDLRKKLANRARLVIKTDF